MKSPIVGGQLPLLEIEGLKPEGKEPYAIEIKKVPDQRRRGTTDITDVEYLLKHDANTAWPLRGDGNYNGGDFRSRECIELLKRADIVITNPPFSLFREYMAQLVEHDKTFLIIGSRNAVHYKEIFKLIKENRVWLGHGFAAGNAYFKIPEEVAREFASGVYDPQTGLVKFRNVGWFTNMDYESRHEKIPLYKKYSPAQYPSYDNYGAIEVAKIADIPADYYGAMGVPDTFLDKYNPDQFEIVGIPFGDLGKEIGVTKNHRGRTDIAITKDGNSSCPYSRIIIKRRA